MRIKLWRSTKTLHFPIQCNGIVVSVKEWVWCIRMWWIPFSIVVMHGTSRVCHKIDCLSIRSSLSWEWTKYCPMLSAWELLVPKGSLTNRIPPPHIHKKKCINFISLKIIFVLENSTCVQWPWWNFIPVFTLMKFHLDFHCLQNFPMKGFSVH